MSALRLAQLPDRVPVKLAITVQPELKKALDDYALLYARNYGAEESVVELIHVVGLERLVVLCASGRRRLGHVVIAGRAPATGQQRVLRQRHGPLVIVCGGREDIVRDEEVAKPAPVVRQVHGHARSDLALHRHTELPVIRTDAPA